MKAKVNGFEIEGTVEEISELVGVSKRNTSTKMPSYSFKRHRKNSWSIAEDEFLRKYSIIWNTKKLTREINKKFSTKRTYNAVISRLWKLQNNYKLKTTKTANMKKRVDKSALMCKMHKQGYSIPVIATKFGLSQAAVYYNFKKRNYDWSKK